MKKSILIVCLVLYTFSVINSASGYSTFEYSASGYSPLGFSTSGYCALCEGHIACNTTGDFNMFCPPDATLIRFTPEERNVLLDAHNRNRNLIAGGGMARFNSATRMNSVSWDFELAWLAELNVMKCRMEHDQCRSTVQFPFAGQNIYMHGTTGDFNPVEQQLNGAINLWWREHELANSTDISNCCGGSRLPEIGHFLQMAQDNLVRIGCASARFTTREWRTTLVTCNYSWGNILNQPVYRSAPGSAPGSACPNNVRHPTFTNLCA